MGLIQAKTYLDEWGRHETGLIKRLCEDFVKNPQDLLIEARAELRRQLSYIEMLCMQVADQEVPQSLLDAITGPAPKITLPDLVVTDVRFNGRSIFMEEPLQAEPGDYIVIEMSNFGPDPSYKVVVVPGPEWEAEATLDDLINIHPIQNKEEGVTQ